MTAQLTRIAIYDMDKTVTRRATYNGFLLHMAWNKSPWRLFLSPLLVVGLGLYAAKVWDRTRLKEFSQQVLIGASVSRGRFARYLESHAELVVGKNVYPQLRERVAEEKADGFRHVMATASYRLYVEAIAARLGFEHVIATDLSTDVLQAAKRGVYPRDMIQPVSPEMRRKYVMVSKDAARGEVRVHPRLRATVGFARMNLMDNAYKVGEPMHMIFCRNVLIYFDKPTQAKVLTRLCDCLLPGGFLYVGHSETVTGISLPVRQVANTVFKKI